MTRTTNTTFSRHLPEFVKYLLVLSVVGFISLLFPNNVKFKYHFHEGQRWNYEDLKAPFDFSIQKTAEEIEVAEKELEANFSPFYSISTEKTDLQITAFEQVFEEQLEKHKEKEAFKDVVNRPKRYLKFGQDFLKNAYQEGIIKLAENHETREKGFVVNIVQGNTTRKETLQNLLTMEHVQQNLKDTLPHVPLKAAEFLLFVLPEKITPNLTYNDTLTQLMKDRLKNEIVTTKGKVSQGELIVMRGNVVTGETYQKLLSFKTKYEEEISNQRSYGNVFTGYFLIACLIMSVFVGYLKIYEPNIFDKYNHLIFILLWFVVSSYMVFAIEKSEELSTYLLPLCIVPIIVKHFFSDRIAFFTHSINILLVSFLTSLGYEFLLVQFLVGFVAVLAVTDSRNWNGFFVTIFAIGLTYAIAFFGLSLIKEGNFQDIPYLTFKWIFLNMLLTMLAFPLIPLLEKIFGFTSSITLVELSDMSRPLLKQLSLQAPGTMQHSLQVANLAEAAAETINANTLLVKTAALYHDIGKVENPLFFIENQTNYNPHDEKTNLESAKIIIEHVANGVKMAKKAGLPQTIIDFIITHHGTTRVEYFYQKEVKENPEKEIDELKFRYTGMRPETKEETILMIADSIEAACKSLKEPTGQEIDEMVEKIIAYKIKERQLEESELTFDELERCKIVFKSLLRSIHHVRVEYEA